MSEWAYTMFTGKKTNAHWVSKWPTHAEEA